MTSSHSANRDNTFDQSQEGIRGPTKDTLLLDMENKISFVPPILCDKISWLHCCSKPPAKSRGIDKKNGHYRHGRSQGELGPWSPKYIISIICLPVCHFYKKVALRLGENMVTSRH